MKALSELTGRARWGSDKWTAQAATWPLAHLHICDDGVILTTPDGAFEFPCGSITQLVCKDSWLSRLLNLPLGVLRIEHSVRDYPSFTLFWSFNITSVRDQLRTAGFDVSA